MEVYLFLDPYHFTASFSYFYLKFKREADLNMLLITAIKDDRNLKHHVSKIGYDLSFQEDLQDQNCYPQDRSKVWNE